MILRKALIKSVSALLLTSAAVATQASGMYAGIAVANNQFNADGPGNNTGFKAGQEFNDSSRGYRLSLGYVFSQRLSAELSLNDYGDATDQFVLKDGIVFIVAPNTIQDYSAKGVVLSLRSAYPINERVSVFGSLGLANTKVDTVFRGGFSEQTGATFLKKSSTEQGLVLGVGLAVAITERLDLRGDFTRTDSGDLTLNQLSAGLDYHF